MGSPLPTIRLFLACQNLVQHRGRAVIDGPIHTLQRPHYPFRLQPVWLYVQMSGVVNACRLSVEVREFETGRQIAVSTEPLVIERTESPLDVIEAHLRMQSFPLPEPNSYDSVLLINGIEVENGLYRVNAYD